MVKLKDWTDKDDAIIKRMAAEGATATTIGKFFGTSRNAVIGRAHRRGITLLGSNSKSVAQRRAGRKRAQQLRRALERLRKTPAMQRVTTRKRWQPGVNLEPAPLPIQRAEDVARVLSIHDLESHHCRWPVGKPGELGFGFCGCQKVDGLSFCEGHAARAYSVRSGAPLSLPTAGRVRDLVDA